MTVPVFVDVDGVINAMPDGEADLMHWPADTWREDLVYSPSLGMALNVTWSTAVIDRLRAIEALPHSEMIWSTTWLEKAPELLAPVIRLGHVWPVAHPGVGSGDRWFDWWKAPRVYEAAEEHGRAVWIDDDIDAWVSMLRIGGRLDELDWIDDRVLTVCPASSRGLTDHELTTIEEFLQ